MVGLSLSSPDLASRATTVHVRVARKQSEGDTRLYRNAAAGTAAGTAAGLNTWKVLTTPSDFSFSFAREHSRAELKLLSRRPPRPPRL